MAKRTKRVAMISELTPAQHIISLDNSGLHGLDRFDLWSDFSQRGVVGLETLPHCKPSDFEFRSTGVIQDGLGIMTIRASPCLIERDPDRAPNLWSDTVMVNFVKSGRLLIEQDGRSTVLNAGDGALCVADRPYTLQLDGGFNGIVLKFSRRYFSARSDLRRLTARSLSSISRMGSLLFNYACKLENVVPILDAQTNRQVIRNFVDTIETSIYASDIGDNWHRPQYKQEIFARITMFVNEHLHDPQLAPGRVSDHFKLSPRYVGKLFMAEGTTLRRYIREQRLEKSAAALRDAAQFGEAITDIVHRYGFKDPAHFARAFRMQFGMTPTAYRKSSAAI